MLSALIEKELKSIIQSPKFFATFAVCSVLMLLSVFIGIKEYQAQKQQYDMAISLSDQQMQSATSWRSLRYKAYREPDPMQIFVTGLTNDIGRWTDISSGSSVKLKSSIYSDDPVFSIFRFIDFAFIVQVVLSLFAILFTYDAICGEREGGTLKLVFSNAVKRSHYIIAKCIGSWLGLVLPMMIPILLSILLVMLFGISLDGATWTKLTLLIGLSILMFSFFITMGVFISSLVKRSNISFLLSLVIWVAFVLIIPRAGVLAAGQIVQIPRVAEIEGRRDAYAKDQWEAFNKESSARWEAFNQESRTGEGEDTHEFDEAKMWERMQQEDSARKIVERKIDDYEMKLQDDLRRRKEMQQKMAFSLSRFSPASAYQLAAMTLAGTDIDLKGRNLDNMQDYRTRFNDYADKKMAESGDMSGVFMIEISSEDGIKMNNKRNENKLDISDRPQYVPSRQELPHSLASLVVDGGLLALYTILAFAGAFIRMLKYDVR